MMMKIAATNSTQQILLAFGNHRGTQHFSLRFYEVQLSHPVILKHETSDMVTVLAATCRS